MDEIGFSPTFSSDTDVAVPSSSIVCGSSSSLSIDKPHEDTYHLVAAKIATIYKKGHECFENWKQEILADLDNNKDDVLDRCEKLLFMLETLKESNVHQFAETIGTSNKLREIWKFERNVQTDFCEPNHPRHPFRPNFSPSMPITPLSAIDSPFSFNAPYPEPMMHENMFRPSTINHPSFISGGGDCYDGGKMLDGNHDLNGNVGCFGDSCDIFPPNRFFSQGSEDVMSAGIDTPYHQRTTSDRMNLFNWSTNTGMSSSTYNNSSPPMSASKMNPQIQPFMPSMGSYQSANYSEASSPVLTTSPNLFNSNGDHQSADYDSHFSMTSSNFNFKGRYTNTNNALNPQSPLMMNGINNNGKSCKGMEMSLRYSVGTFGNPSEQLNAPHGLSMGQDGDVVVCDTNNHRIVIISSKMGHFSFGSGGVEEGLLYYPKKVVTFQYRGVWRHIILDRGGPARLQQFAYDGTFRCRFNTAINSDQINAMSYDEENSTFLIIDSKGIITGFSVDSFPEFHRRLLINCGRHIREPSDVLCHKSLYYVTDYKAHNICVFDTQANLIRKFGNTSITPYPVGLSVTPNDIILVGDSHGNRYHISGFNSEGKLVTEHECPDV
uniref:BTB domain-containing protein n=1 Tax=Rhabditophanes sp. KR3021 TaxID=114890 RepID=A0AC35UD18_9BILA